MKAIISIMSPKGGIGKTTTADSIAYILGEEHKQRVLIVEGDPQGDTSRTFGRYEPEGVGMSELLEKHHLHGGAYATKELIKKTRFEHIDIIAGNGYLTLTDGELRKKTDENQVLRFKAAISEVEDEYDYCICDCGRLLDLVVINLLLASDLVIAPIKIGGYELEALQNLMEQVGELKALNKKMQIKVIMTMRQKNKTSLEMQEWLQENYDMFETAIRNTTVAGKATLLQKVLPECSKRCTAAQDYRNVVKEILEIQNKGGEMQGGSRI